MKYTTINLIEDAVGTILILCLIPIAAWVWFIDKIPKAHTHKEGL